MSRNYSTADVGAPAAAQYPPPHCDPHNYAARMQADVGSSPMSHQTTATDHTKATAHSSRGAYSRFSHTDTKEPRKNVIKRARAPDPIPCEVLSCVREFQNSDGMCQHRNGTKGGRDADYPRWQSHMDQSNWEFTIGRPHILEATMTLTPNQDHIIHQGIVSTLAKDIQTKLPIAIASPTAPAFQKYSGNHREKRSSKFSPERYLHVNIVRDIDYGPLSAKLVFYVFSPTVTCNYSIHPSIHNFKPSTHPPTC